MKGAEIERLVSLEQERKLKQRLSNYYASIFRSQDLISMIMI